MCLQVSNMLLSVLFIYLQCGTS
uniref:Uncharacterized protein n=1 Tax=Arundo donax TaxID=35708 RepID=A0A0A8ZBW5_ARUDO